MSEEDAWKNEEPTEPPDEGNGEQSPDPSGPGPQSQAIQHSQVSALVPEAIAPGVFSTGAVVLQGAHEFILDFLIRMQQPQQVAARIVLPHSVIPQFLKALQENIRKYEDRFGAIPNPAKAVQQQQQQEQKASAQELYDNLKLSDEVMTGQYANAVMIGHSAYEFSFDFITTFFPRSAVAARVYLSAPNVPKLMESIKHSWGQFQQQRQQPPPDSFGTGTFGDGS